MPGKYPVKFKYLIRIIFFLVLAFAALSGAAAHSSEVTLQWEAPSDDRVKGYYVYYGPAPYNFDSADQDIIIDDPDVTSCTISDLIPGPEHQVAMKSFDADGNQSALSEIITFVAPEEDPDDASNDGSSEDGGGSGGCFIGTLLQ